MRVAENRAWLADAAWNPVPFGQAVVSSTSDLLFTVDAVTGLMVVSADDVALMSGRVGGSTPVSLSTTGTIVAEGNLRLVDWQAAASSITVHDTSGAAVDFGLPIIVVASGGSAKDPAATGVTAGNGDVWGGKYTPGTISIGTSGTVTTTGGTITSGAVSLTGTGTASVGAVATTGAEVAFGGAHVAASDHYPAGASPAGGSLDGVETADDLGMAVCACGEDLLTGASNGVVLVDNTLIGDDAANTLAGGGVIDALFGLAGDDWLFGGSVEFFGGYNALYGGDGLDTASYAGETTAVTASLADLWAYVGGVANANLRDVFNSVENLVGGSGADVLIGDADVNTLTGGRGADQLYGGDGADVFVYAGYADSNGIDGYDTVADFVHGIDKVDLRAFRTDANHVEILSSGGATALYVLATPDATHAVTVLAISFMGADALTTADILF